MADSKKRSWGSLIGSKRRITLITSGFDPGPPEKLSDDLLKGAEEIARFVGLDPRQVYQWQHWLGLRRAGKAEAETAKDLAS